MVRKGGDELDGEVGEGLYELPLAAGVGKGGDRLHLEIGEGGDGLHLEGRKGGHHLDPAVQRDVLDSAIAAHLAARPGLGAGQDDRGEQDECQCREPGGQGPAGVHDGGTVKAAGGSPAHQRCHISR
jgi:hypothetical protein